MIKSTVTAIKAIVSPAAPVTSVAQALAPFQTVADNLRSVIFAKEVDIEFSNNTIAGAEAYLVDIKAKNGSVIAAAKAESESANAVLAKLEDMLGSM